MTMLCQRHECTGCGACFNVCPISCIEMRPDSDGFLSPFIDVQLCTKCQRCHKACPILFQPSIVRGDPPDVYACWNLDDEVRMESSSGGMFSVFADYILENNGVVYGASLDDQQNLKHAGISLKSELGGARKSKYFQSDIAATFREAKEHLESGRLVLFTGTPCQIAGLYGFLGENSYLNLITADIICHGVPSPMVFKKYQRHLEVRYRSPIRDISLRDKTNGWLAPDTLIHFGNGKQYRKSYIAEDPYARAFLANICLRESCHCCHYTSTRRFGDITLADFWGIGREEPFDYDTDKGVSLVLLNTGTGRMIFDKNKHRFFSTKRELVEAINGNIHLQSPSKMHPDREAFLRDLHSIDFAALVDKYVPMPKGWRAFMKNMMGRKGVSFIRAIKCKVRRTR